MEKRVLMLGASCFYLDAYKYARKNNIYTIAVDMRDEQKAICKQIADVSYMTSTKDIEALIEIAEKEKVNGIYVGASETNMPVAIELSKRLGISFYCKSEQWAIGTNKRLFKEMCIRHRVPVTKFYNVNSENYMTMSKVLEYPVVTKPVDNNGSTGITVCRNVDEFLNGYEKALGNSKTADVLVEEYMPYDSVIIHYTMINGKANFCGMSDKKSKKISDEGAPVMAIQYFPAKQQKLYEEQMNKNVMKMFEQEGFEEGPIWIEAFSDGESFIFNEMGYRFGGSMTYHAVEYFTQIDQIGLLMNHAFGGEKKYYYKAPEYKKVYCIVPIHIRSGKIKKIVGIDRVKESPKVYTLAMCHVEGDEIEATGTVSQVFCYLHLLLDDREEVDCVISSLLGQMKAYDEKGINLLTVPGKMEMDNRKFAECLEH